MKGWQRVEALSIELVSSATRAASLQSNVSGLAEAETES